NPPAPTGPAGHDPRTVAIRPEHLAGSKGGRGSSTASRTRRGQLEPSAPATTMCGCGRAPTSSSTSTWRGATSSTCGTFWLAHGRFVKALGYGRNAPGFGPGTKPAFEITGPHGTAVVNLEGVGRLDLADLLKHHALLLPPH